MRGLRSYLLVTVSAAAFSTGALAADIPARMPVKAPAPVAAPWSWAGFYIGINAGVAWNRAEFTDLGTADGCCGYSFPRGTTFWSPSKAGFTGGGQAGYNFQSGNIVYGIEVDANWVNGKTSTLILPQSVSATTKLEWMATARGRVGLTLSPTLVYVTGGLAVGHFEDNYGATFRSVTDFSSSRTRLGWTAGGGVEHMFARNWTVKIEALYADFGDWTVQGPPTGLTFYRARFAHEVITVRGGLNLKW
jgi:outer membrane immunogenic protein